MAKPKRKAEKKWARAKGPKVRTGCLTCKKRRLKCDERKPSCKKCEDDRYTCDGYLLNFARKPPQKPQPPATNGTTIIIRQTTEILFPRPLPCLSLDASVTSKELHLLHHVRTCTVEDLASSLSPMEFWYIHVLPLGHSIDSVRQAICALGSAHKYFKSSHLDPASVTSSMVYNLQRSSILHYNQAIQSIQPLMEDPSLENIEIILTCCIIFICIENLQGRYNECLRHVHAAGAILTSFLENSITIKRPEIFDVVIQMLVRLGQDISVYTGDEMVPDLNFFPPVAVDLGHPETAFSSAVEAEKALNVIEMALSTALRDGRMGVFEETLDCGPFDAIVEHDPTLTPVNSDAICLENMEPYFNHWSARFELYKDALDATTIAKQELHHVAALSVEQALWLSTLRVKSMNDYFLQEDYEDLIRRAEVLASICFDNAPVFAFDGNLIPALSILCTLCPDTDIQKRCINILRSMVRREGVWDSQQVADILEAMLAARANNLLTWDTFHYNVPQLAERLKSCHVSDLNVPEGILLLAAKSQR